MGDKEEDVFTKNRAAYLLTAVFTLCMPVEASAGQNTPALHPTDAEISNALESEIFTYSAKEMVSEKVNSYEALLATKIMAAEGHKLSDETIRGLMKIANAGKNGFKELFATQILIEAGCLPSNHALDRAFRMATGQLKDKPFAEEKKRQAKIVLQAYRDLVLKKKTQ